MSKLRVERCKAYAAMRGDGPPGAASDKRNIEDWIDRATRNSEIAPRSKDGPMKLSTKINVRDTGMRPKAARKVDAIAEGRSDVNHAGSAYLPNVRRGG
jgi:hypothetical protein